MAKPTYPTAFHFSVSFTGSSRTISDVMFQEVSGLESSFEEDVIVEGGENRFVHQLPKKAKKPNLKLQRALTTKDNELVKWCKSSIEGSLAKPIEPMDLTVSLIDANSKVVATWLVTNAYPVKWEIGGFDAMKNELALETVELAYLSTTKSL
ncbi:phage tail protein [Aliiroseovarius sp. 2305UL8-7]|uniref:phage tail protein n=1 Tax=Aliiroseovarius conchicola TaxID=3121637 RepID=UPI003527F929